MAHFLKDFDWRWDGLTVKETGADVRFTPDIIGDFFVWLIYFFCEHLRSAITPLPDAGRLTYISTPNTIRPWYLLGGALIRAKASRIPQTHKTDKNLRGVQTSDPDAPAPCADVAIHFLDQTYVAPTTPPRARHTLNFACRDISKTKVATVFADVFGYALSVNPETHHGPMVMKSEKNGAHDGHIVQGPTQHRDGWTYQKEIATLTNEGRVRDLRCVTLQGQIIVLYIKERPLERRFDNLNTRCVLANADEYFTPKERSLVSQFCQKMGLDWGGLDILRDKCDGRIYIVDVNKTDMGPPLSLPLRDKLRSTSKLAEALITAFTETPS